MLHGLTTITLLLVLVSCANKRPNDAQSHTLFTDVVAAVTAAANRYNPISIREDREFMGTVYRDGNRYGYTVSSGRIGSGSSDVYLRLSEFDDIVAFWHTHGRPHPIHAYFSRQDTEVANKFDVPMYLADHNGTLKVYRPGGQMMPQFKIKNTGAMRGSALAEGELVRNRSDRPVHVRTRRVQ